VHLLPFLEEDAVERAPDMRANRDGGDRSDGADGGQLDRHFARLCALDRHLGGRPGERCRLVARASRQRRGRRCDREKPAPASICNGRQPRPQKTKLSFELGLGSAATGYRKITWTGSMKNQLAQK